MSAASGRLPIAAVFGRLLTLLDAHRPALAASIALSILAAVASLVPHLAVAVALIELLAPAPDAGTLLACAAAGATGVLLRHGGWGAAMLISHRIAYRTQYDLRKKLAEKLARVPLGFFDRHSKGRLRATILDDVNLVEDGMAHLVPETSAALLTPLLAFVAMAWLDWRLAVLALIPTIAGVRLLGATMSKGADVTRRHQSAAAKLGHVASEYAEGLATIRAFDQQNQALERANSALAELTAVTVDWLRRSVAPASFSQILLVANVLLVAPAGLWLHLSGAVTIQTLILFLVLTLGMGDLFAGIAGLAHRLTRKLAVLDRIDAILSAPELPIANVLRAPADASITFDRVTFAYGDRAVLRDVSFRIAPGQCVALVGASGSGKTTTAKLVARFHDVSEGAVRVGGCDVRAIDPDRLAGMMAIVFQDVFLFEGSIADNVRLGRLDATDTAVAAALDAANCTAFVSRLPQGMETRLTEGGGGLSGGERQRLSIARAILKDAPIVVLDEATAFADPENELALQTAMSRLAADKTVLVIAHRLRSIATADLILVFDDGRIVERGRHDALLAKHGHYARLWAAQGTSAAREAPGLAS